MSLSLLGVACGALQGLAASVAQSLFLVVFASLVFQAQVYMRTDFFFALENYLRCGNLFGDAMAYLTWWRHRALAALGMKSIKTRSPLEAIPQAERRKVQVYSLLVLAGSVLALATAALFGLPVLIALFVRSFETCLAGTRNGDVLIFLDGLVVMLVEGAVQILFLILLIRKKRHWWAAIGKTFQPRRTQVTDLD